MKLSQLRYLYAVQQYGSISKAAQSLFVSQPTLSIAIKEMEKEFGVALLERDKGKVRFTHAGQTMVEGAEKILFMVDELSSQMRRLSQDITEIRVGFSAAMSKQILPRLMKSIEAFEAERPLVKIRPIERQYNLQFEALRSGITTMAFGKNLQNFDPDLEYIPLLENEIMLCVGPGHRLAQREIVSMADFAEETILTFLKLDSKTNIAIHDWARAQGREIDFNYYSQIGVVEELIRLGMGVALLVPSIYIRNPDIVTVPIENAVKLEYGMFYLKNRYLSEAERAFIELTREVLQQ